MTPSREPRREHVRWWLASALLAAAAFLIPVPSWVVDEFYSRDLYPWLQSGVTAASNLLPVAVLDVMIVIAVALGILRAVRLVMVAWYRGVLTGLWECVRRVIRAAAFVALAFFWGWGCNYRRLPLENTLANHSAVQPTTENLQVMVADANALAARLRPALSVQTAPTYPELAVILKAPMNTALADLNLAGLSRPGRPKFSMVLTPFFTWAGVNGMVNPLALESIVHPDLLPFERPFVLAHEWAHLAGEADEAEASAVGWLACMKGEPVLAYSASIYVILEGAGALPAQARRRAFMNLDAGVREDLNAIARRMEKEKPRVRQTATRVYDRYLKANEVPDGVASYSRALSLILASPIHDALNEYSVKGR